MSPTTKKILIGVSIFLAVMLLGCVIFAVAGASWLEQWATGMQEQGERASVEGAEFAAGHDQEACVVDGLRRDDLCAGSLTCEVGAGVFLQRCLELATPVPGLCDEVPPRGEIVRSAQWTVAECNARGHVGSQPCTRLIPAIQRHCESIPRP